MTSTNKSKTTVLCLILFLTAFTITLTNAATENNYKNESNLLPRISENTRAENGYNANIIINPYTTGIIAKENGFTLDLAINPQGIGGALTENNYRLDLIPEKTFPDSADVAVTGIATSKTIVFQQGYSVLTNVTLSNQALNYATFYFTTNANTTVINAQAITLTSGNSATITFTWNTTGLAKGNYTISAYAWPVPGEANTANNNFTDSYVIVSMVGDLVNDTGSFMPDGKVDGADIAVVAMCFGAYPGAPPPLLWYSNCDVDNNGHCDGADIAIVAGCFGQSDP